MADRRTSRLPPLALNMNDGMKAGLLIAVIALLYARSLWGGFIWDDVTYIVGNKLLKDPQAFLRIWSDRALPDFWPISYSLFWLEYRLFGLEVTGYHAVCLLLHAVNGLLLWQVLRRLGFQYAFAAALLFAVHPVCVEAVAWIFQAKTTLAAALALGALWLYLGELHRPPSKGRYLAALALFLMAMAAKASVVTWPLAMLLCAHLLSREDFRRQLVRVAPFFFVAALMGAINLWWYSGHGPEAPSELIRDDALLSRIALAGMSFWFYLGKALWPLDLAFVYPRWQSDALGALAIVPSLLALLVALIIIWHRKERRWGRPLFYGLGYVLVTLLPVLGVFEIYFMRYSFVADHWQYMSLMGLIALLVEGVGRALKSRPRLAQLLAALALLLLGGLTWRQTAIYRDEETIWRDTLTKNPGSWMVHNSLGLVLKKQGHFDEALAHYSEALRLYPQAQSYYNMGLIFDQKGDLEQALALYTKAAALNPYYNIIFTNMGIVLAKLGRQQEARVQLERAVALAPSAENHYNLGFFLEGSGELGLARDHLAEAIRLDPASELFRAAWQRVETAIGQKSAGG